MEDMRIVKTLFKLYLIEEDLRVELSCINDDMMDEHDASRSYSEACKQIIKVLDMTDTEIMNEISKTQEHVDYLTRWRDYLTGMIDVEPEHVDWYL